jgi:hypothetical protein
MRFGEPYLVAFLNRTQKERAGEAARELQRQVPRLFRCARAMIIMLAVSGQVRCGVFAFLIGRRLGRCRAGAHAHTTRLPAFLSSPAHAHTVYSSSIVKFRSNLISSTLSVYTRGIFLRLLSKQTIQFLLLIAPFMHT